MKWLPNKMKARFSAGLFLLLLFTATAVAGDDPWLEQAKLIASDGVGEDQFSYSVALTGDTAVVGAWVASVDGSSFRGAAYVFVRDGEDWTEQAKLTALDGAASHTFGDSVAISGDTILVGASQRFALGTGAVYVFVRDGEAWTEQAKLTASDGTAGAAFGFSVALSGDTALIGAKNARVNSFDNGAAYVFTRDGGGTWTQQTRLVPDDWPFGNCSSSNCPEFGYSVALSETTALVGAQRMEVDGSPTGAAYVFVREEGVWAQQAMLTRSEPASSEFFGTSVALRSDTALVGSPEVAVGGNTRQGAAHVFARNGSTWTEQQELTASDGTDRERFGHSVALLDDILLVGANEAEVGGNNRQGAAYVFTFDGETWIEQQKLTASDGAGDDHFGISAALSGNTALVGAFKAMIDGNARQGAAYVFAAEPSGVPDLTFDPAGLDFGEVEVGDTSVPQSATLSNNGEANVTGLNFSTPGSGFDADTGDCGETLPVGESCEVSITFTPAGPGPADTTLEAGSNEGVTASLALTGNGIEPPPQPGVLSVEPAELDFGTVEVGQAEALTVTVANTAKPGSGALTLDALGLDGGESTESTTELVTIDPDGNQFPFGNEAVSRPNFSADGRFVVFEARPCGTCATRLYRRDLVAESTELVSVDSDGGEISGRDPQISADGRYVVFRAGGCGGQFCRRDMDAGALEPIVLPTTDGESPNSSLFRLASSADLRFISFYTLATNLLPGGSGNEVYVYDTDTDTLERVSEPFEGFAGDGSSIFPAISADGRYVAFRSTSTNLVPDDTNDVVDIFVHDRQTGTTERVSVASDGSEGNGGSGTGGSNGAPSISADGRYVAFQSLASNLVPDDTNGNNDVFVHDRNTGMTELVSVANDGTQDWGTKASISADGRFVAFYGGALVPDDTNGQPDTYIHDRDTGTTERVSVAPDGSQILFADNQNAISADGRFVLFRSHDPNVVVPGTNSEHHLYVRDRGFVAITPFTITGGDCAVTTVLEPGDTCTVEITFSPDSTGFFEDVLNVETTDAQSQAVPLQGSGGELEDQIFHHRFEDGGAP